MLAETEFYKLGKQLMFLIFNDKYFYIENSQKCEDNFLFASGLTLPLTKGNTLEETDENYESKYEKEIQEYKEKKIQELQEMKTPFRELEKDLEKNEFLAFYLEQIQNQNNKKINYREINETEHRKIEFPTLKGILNEYGLFNFFVVNRRIFHLVTPDNKNRDPYVKLNGKKYYLAKTRYISDDIEKSFKNKLEARIKDLALEEAPLTQELRQKTAELKSYINNLEKLRDLVKKDSCYELKWLGFDLEKCVLYYQIPKFYNQLHKRQYKTGESAFGIPLIKKNIGEKTIIGFNYNDADRKYLTRDDINQGFKGTEWACIGFNGSMSDRTYNPKEPDNFQTALKFLQLGVTTILDKGKHRIA